MKNVDQVVTYYFGKNGKPDGFPSWLVLKASKLKSLKFMDKWPIEDRDHKVCGYFYGIFGPKPIADFLSWITNRPFHKTDPNNSYVVWTTPNGKIDEIFTNNKGT